MPQTATLLDESLRENILFGREYKKDRFEKVIYACNLKNFIKIIQKQKIEYLVKEVSQFQADKDKEL